MNRTVLTKCCARSSRLKLLSTFGQLLHIDDSSIVKTFLNYFEYVKDFDPLI